ncbi:prepilin peptidase [Alkalilimnicola ehrlichii]|uniref:Prepilin leader peptidase/N-methyltransferase n=1 Tax=Alkalilimnicola ehrlichii TaxID=351052 RepID=A0A3E0WY25_9GAMM|nr:A24 family peptidase [Alkalilimnicola ehrlichii]RFA30336.1 prepilin peptidase [Alkalilimnicola ehrlichii]RFA37910.1 prepilin peptidase [Alkalilimnicola ehrlichii]
MFDYLQDSLAAFIGVTFVLGLLVGSFLNVVILRVPKMLEADWRQQCEEFLNPDESTKTPERRHSLWWPPSHCPECQRRIRPWENIPVISYLWLKGRCRGCKTTISIRYPVVELFTAIVSAVVAWQFGYSFEAAAALLLSWSLIALSGIDLDHQLLPDNLTLPLIWIGLLLSLGGYFTQPQDAIIGAVAGYLSLWSVFHLFRLLTGKEGMGYGDFKLLAVFGAWLGWQALPVVILLSSLVGALVGIALIAFRGQDRNVPIPFGPYLAAAGWIALLWQDDLVGAYLRWAGLN